MMFFRVGYYVFQKEKEFTRYCIKSISKARGVSRNDLETPLFVFFIMFLNCGKIKQQNFRKGALWMGNKRITEESLGAFADFLRREERSEGTVEKYSREISIFLKWLNGCPVDQERVIQWKQHLVDTGNTPSTINGMLVALNRFLVFIGHTECKVATLKLQRRLFREEKRDLTKEEYVRLIETARAKGKERLALLMQLYS